MKKITKTFVLFAFYVVGVFLFGCEYTTPQVLLAPQDIRVVAVDNECTVFFDKVENADGYYVYFYENYEDQEGSLAFKYYSRRPVELQTGVKVSLPDGDYKICVQSLDSTNTYDDSVNSEYYYVTLPNELVPGPGPGPVIEDEYTITYVLNGGSLSNPTYTFKKGDTVILPTPTKKEYTFVGWYKDASFTNSISVISKDVCENVIVYAKWDYNGGGGSTTYETYYHYAEGKTGTALKGELRSIISTGVKTTTYDNLKKYLCITDADPDDSSKMLLLFSHEKVNAKWDSASTWNREHVWPQSKGWFTTSGAGADLQHIRPEDPTVNGVHGNLPYGKVTNGKELKYRNKVVAHYNSYFEPLDEFKGDIARIIFYLLVRYSESDNYKITNVAQSMQMLLEWNALDPVDNFELIRNERAYSIQKNRNPFIDHPEFANMIWG